MAINLATPLRFLSRDVFDLAVIRAVERWEVLLVAVPQHSVVNGVNLVGQQRTCPP